MRNQIIDNLRGLCMLGVIGIHTGSLALAPNDFTLYVLLEVLSRYSVPAFFFISGYGLFCTDRPLLTGGADNFSYAAFMKKRLKGAGLPYLSWSLLYMLYFWLILPPGYVSWRPAHVLFVLFFGLGCYHLYFMVILLWFYGTYPLWRRLMGFMRHAGLKISLALLLAFQLAFNWWTTHPGVSTQGWNVLALNFFQYRLNYLPLHYLLIFMMGGLAAFYWDSFRSLLRRYTVPVTLFYTASIAWDVGSCLHAVRSEGYSLLDLANTFHQLSPQGLVYTIASLLFFCAMLDRLEEASSRADAGFLSKTAQKAITVLSANSMLIYFVHPLILDWMTSFYHKSGIVMTVKKVTFSYFLLVFAALALSLLLTQVFKKNKIVSLLFTGHAGK